MKLNYSTMNPKIAYLFSIAFAGLTGWNFAIFQQQGNQWAVLLVILSVALWIHAMYVSFKIGQARIKKEKPE